MTPPEVQPQNAKKITLPEVQPKRFVQWLKQLKVPQLKPESILLGGAMLAAVGLAVTQYEAEPPSVGLDPNQFCQEIVQPKAVVSREQLAQLLTVPERGSRSKVQAIVKEPYCRMPSLSIRAGATTERVAYPLTSDPQTWIVILYEGKTYVGYGLKRA
jgi:hypothetical protein